MTARRLLLVALAMLAGCKSTSTRPSLRLAGPAAVAVFHGVTLRDAANLRAYFAVANERGDDLRILDAIDGQSVLAPALVQSLSVSTAPRPSMLAAGGLADADPAGKADLLVVAPTGLAACDPAAPARLSGCVQVVATWTPATALATSLTVVIDDLPGGADAVVLSLAVAPVAEADGAGGWRPAAGRARVLAGLSGGRLLIAEYQRAIDGVGIVLAGAAVHDLGFDPLSLSPSPETGKVYAAALDAIGGVEGVAELDLTGASPAVRPIPAGLPTTHVLAVRVRLFAGLTSDPKLDLHGPEVLRVYAALDPDRCGRDEAVTCGLAVLDPVAGGPAADPAGQLPAHLPIALPGRISALAAVYPPALGSLTEAGAPSTSPSDAAFQKLAAATSYRWTSTLAAVGTTAGAAYLVDLARGAAAVDRDLLATSVAGGQARLTSASSVLPPDSEQPLLGLWNETLATPEVSHDSLVMPNLATMTPGFTQAEAFDLRWEGLLPHLSSLSGQVQAGAGGVEWVAVQSVTGADLTAPPYRGVARLYDPRLFIQARHTRVSDGALVPGDIVVVTPSDAAACPVAFELEVTGFLPPDDLLYPGGALAVAPRAVQPASGNPACLDGKGRVTARLTIRSSGLVLTGSAFGYAGRPEARASAAEPPYVLAWEDTSALSCPALETSAWPPPACDQACRDACERILISRRARRSFYLAEQCLDTDTACKGLWGAGAVVNPTGPVLTFKPGWVYRTGSTGTAEKYRNTGLIISAQSGQAISARRPLSGTSTVGAALPSGAAAFDRTDASKVESTGARVFVTYPSNLVLDFSPAAAATVVTVYK